MQGRQPPFFDKLKMNTKFLIMEDDLNFVTEGRKAEPADHPRVQPPGKEVSTLILPDVLQREVNIELYCVHHYRFVDCSEWMQAISTSFWGDLDWLYDLPSDCQKRSSQSSMHGGFISIKSRRESIPIIVASHATAVTPWLFFFARHSDSSPNYGPQKGKLADLLWIGMCQNTSRTGGDPESPALWILVWYSFWLTPLHCPEIVLFMDKFYRKIVTNFAMHNG